MSETVDLRMPWDAERGEYKLPGACTNCDWSGRITIPKGREAPNRSWRAAQCPRCGCKSVQATHKWRT